MEKGKNINHSGMSHAPPVRAIRGMEERSENAFLSACNLGYGSIGRALTDAGCSTLLCTTALPCEVVEVNVSPVVQVTQRRIAVDRARPFPLPCCQ